MSIGDLSVNSAVASANTFIILKRVMMMMTKMIIRIFNYLPSGLSTHFLVVDVIKLFLEQI